jgi:predicted AlkP superfamily phosphohydrolase/phosphomutase
MKPRLAVFGLDGARFDLVQKWVSEGYLPTIKNMISGGAAGSVKTVLPGPHSFPAWTSFATGKNPGKHGLCYPIVPDFENRKLKFLDSTANKEKKIWNYLSEAGKVVGVMDLPILYPVESVNGIMVSSWGTPALESEYTYPKNIKQIMDKFEAWTIPNCYERSKKALDNLYKATDKKFKSIYWFFDNYDWDFFVNEFVGTELLHHLYSPFLNPTHHQYNPKYEFIIRDYYTKLDRFFARLLERYPGLNIILMSDHGFCTNKEYIYVNNILEKYGLFVKHAEFEERKNWMYHKTISALTKIFLVLPPSLKRGVSAIIPKGIAKRIKHEMTINMDWNESIAFCQYMGMIYINKACRRIRSGELSVADAVKQVVSVLKHDPYLKGKYLGIYTKEELFQGDKVNQQPDIILDLKEDYDTSNKTPKDKLGDKIMSKLPTRHTIDALFIAYGPMFKKGVKPKNRTIMDIMPTILYGFGLPIPKDIDGTIMKEIFNKFSASKIKFKGKEESALDAAIMDIKF